MSRLVRRLSKVESRPRRRCQRTEELQRSSREPLFRTAAIWIEAKPSSSQTPAAKNTVCWAFGSSRKVGLLYHGAEICGRGINGRKRGPGFLRLAFAPDGKRSLPESAAPRNPRRSD